MKGGRERAARGGTYGNWGIDALDVALLDEDLHGLEAERLDLRLRERLAPLQLLDLPVQIRRPHLRRRRWRAVPTPSLSPPPPSRSFRKRRGGGLLAGCFSKILGLGGGVGRGRSRWRRVWGPAEGFARPRR